MKFEFGLVVTADFLPETRMMVLYPATEPTRIGLSLDPLPGRENWWAVVLRDEGTWTASWKPGDFITLSPDNAGLRIVDTSEGTTE